MNLSCKIAHIIPVNTFTEHRGGDWSVKDMQHTYVAPSHREAFSHMNFLEFLASFVGLLCYKYLHQQNL
jgi:hypothetical protein